MPKKYADKTVLVRDNSGWYLELAIRLSRDFGKTLYYNEWKSSAPRSYPMYIGEDIEGIEKVDDLWQAVDRKKKNGEPYIDLFVYPDIYSGGEQLHLVSLKRNVFGSRMAEELETDRFATSKYLKKLGLPQPEGKYITGMDNLIKYLKENEDQYVKIDFTRGDDESWHHINYDLSRSHLDALATRLGVKQDIMQWFVTQPINDAVEPGIDVICIDGKYSKQCLAGVEVKDNSYVCKVRDYESLPKQLTDITNALADDLKDYGYRNFFSTENRVTKDKSYPIDITARAGIPPYEIQLELIDNISEVIWEGSQGNLIDWQTKYKYGAQCTIIAHEAEKDCYCVEVPDDVRQFVKLRSFAKHDGKYYILPSEHELVEIGAIVGLGNTMEEAIESCKKTAEKVKGFKIEIETSKLDDAVNQIDKCKEFGIDIDSEH